MRNAPTVALAILTVGEGYALQLRDEIPTIASPGRWALFGGSLSDGETPRVGIQREILEELRLNVTDWRYLWTVLDYVRFWHTVGPHVIFAADVTTLWSSHVVQEGQAAQVFPVDGLPQPMDALVSALLERYHEQVRPYD